MKKLLLLLLFGAAALPAFSQGRDTAFAVRKLFRQKRGGADGLASLGLSGISSPADIPAALVMGAVPAVFGLRKAVRYGAAREAAILTSYANGWPVPADIRHQLRRKHFHRTAADVQTGR